jgi:hypothetical protein
MSAPSEPLEPERGGRIVIPNFDPRPYQLRVMRYLDNGGKRAVCVWHRRAGKDLVGGHQACKAMHRRVGSYWHIFPTERLGRKAIWTGFTKTGERIMEQIFPRAIRKSPREWTPTGEMVVELRCGSIWRLMGSDRMEVVGAGPAGVVFSEYSVAKPKTWDLVRPMLRENDGWALFLFTPRGNNHGKAIFDTAGKGFGWFQELLTLNDTRAYDPASTIADERASGMPEALIQQEYFCDWTAANIGSVFGDLLHEVEKAGKTGLDFASPRACFTSWDLGIADKTAIWVWALTPEGLTLFDYIEASGKPFSFFADWLKGKDYKYLKHWLPHDARARNLLTGGTVVELASAAFGAENVGITPELSLADGIQAARWLLQKPIRFHRRCEEGVEALKAYAYDWDDEKKAFSKKPLHDWSSHGADAFRYVACVVRVSEAMVDGPAQKVVKMPKPITEVTTLDNLWREEAAKRDNFRRI